MLYQSKAGKLKQDFDHIIRGCCKNNRDAQNLLYRQYYSYGLSICFRYVKDVEEAKLILNSAFLKVFKNIKKFNSNYDFKPWFKTITVNTAINHIKKMKKFDVEVGLDEVSSFPTADDVLSKIGFDELLTTIQNLSLAYRTVFNMYVMDGFKHEEIAKKLGISVSTSKSNLSRAKGKLREMIQGKYQLNG